MKRNFLDSSKKYKLSELECELVSLFRELKKSEQRKLFKLLFDYVFNKKEI